jgi:hypothetical protein
MEPLFKLARPFLRVLCSAPPYCVSVAASISGESFGVGRGAHSCSLQGYRNLWSGVGGSRDPVDCPATLQKSAKQKRYGLGVQGVNVRIAGC